MGSCSNTYILELIFNVVVAMILAALLALALSKTGKARKLTTVEIYLLLSGAGFSLTLLIRQYTHYWALAIPFFAILGAGWLRRDKSIITDRRTNTGPEPAIVADPLHAESAIWPGTLLREHDRQDREDEMG